MLKYYNLINQLSDRDKIRLLCDIHCLADEKYAALGIPQIKVGEIDDYLSGKFPSAIALANSWDREMIGAVASAAVGAMRSDGVNLAVMPTPKMKINPFRPTLSEDPYLSSEMAKAYFQAAKKASVATCLDDFRLTVTESDWMDANPDERFVYEAIVKPYAEAVQEGSCVAVLTDSSHIADSYKDINRALTEEVSSDRYFQGQVPMSRKLPVEHTASHFANGGLAFEASAVILEAALSKYRQMKKEIEQGKVTAEELQGEILAGRAISDELLDAAVDRLLTFAFSIQGNALSATASHSSNDLRINALAASTVMLKNEKAILPLQKSSRICVIGDVARAENAIGEALGRELTQLGYDFRGFERGYDLLSERSDALFDAAQRMASNADVAIVFLGFGTAREKRLHKLEKLSIPANQLDLLERLSNTGVKIVAVLPSEYCPDIVLDSYVQAILMMPLNVDYSAHVLSLILDGTINPSGRLASSVYMETDALYTEHKTYRRRDGIKTGQFIGYRYYDTADFYPCYPFGHGIGYTQFSYSQLSVSESSVTFTVKNTGRVRGIETAQVYIGIQKSAWLRPSKVLMNFARVELDPGERKTVTLPLRLPTVYHPEQKRWICEFGEYTVYVGASVGEIKMTQKITCGNETLKSDGKSLCDYIQSESNIITDNYKLEARCDTMKKSVFNFIVGGSALALAIGLKLFCVFARIDAIFLDIVSALIAIGGIALFIFEGVTRNRIYLQTQEALDKKNEEAFEDADQLPVYDAEQMFAVEFDGADEAETVQQEIHTEALDTEYLKHIDKEQSFLSATRDFEMYAAEKGYYLDSDTVKSIFASLASSRLLLTEGMDEESFHDLMLLLCGYFESNIYIDATDESYVSADSVLFGTDRYGTRVRTNAFAALESACGNMKKIHFSALTNVHAEDLPKYFTPYVNYVKNPLSQYHVTVLNDKNVESSYYIPPNMWFILNLAHGESIDMIPDFVSEVSTLNHIRMTKREPIQREGVFRSFSYYQMEYLVEKLAASYAVDEDIWKRIDRLEAYVNGYVPYHIGNKLWLCMEKYALVHVACESETVDAVDGAVCAKLLPSIVAKLKGRLPKEEKSFEETLEAVFGEGRVERCLRFIKTCGISLT